MIIKNDINSMDYENDYLDDDFFDNVEELEAQLAVDKEYFERIKYDIKIDYSVGD